MLKKMAVFLTFAFFGAVAVALIVFFAGCISAPDKDDYNNDFAYYQAYCLYLNQKNQDKSSCSGFYEIIRDREKEKRFYDRLKYCRDEKHWPDRWDFDKCTLYLNQK